VIEIGQLDEYVSSLAKMNVLNKKNAKSANLLNIQYKVMNKVFGPFLDLFVDVKNMFETASEVVPKFNKEMQETGEAVEVAMGPIGAFLKALRVINTVMIMILGIFAAVGAAIYLLASHVGEGAGDFEILNKIGEASKKLFEAIGDTFDALMGAFGAVDWGVVSGIVLEGLQGIFDALGMVLIIYITLYTEIILGIGKVIAKMDEAGMFQRIGDAIAVLLGSFMVAFDLIAQAISDTGLTFEDIIEGIQGAVDYFVGFLFSSGIIEFFVQVIELASTVWALIVVIFGVVVSLFIRVWAQLGPPLVNFVRAVFDFLDPIIRIITGIIGVIIDLVMGLIGWLLPYFETGMGVIMDLLQPVIDLITWLLDGVSTVLDGVSGFFGGAADLMGFSDGGVASGPSSGYPVALHGTEAVVPLPDGRTIPVSIKGDMGGGGSTNNITINVSGGGGNAKEIAKAVSEEVSKVMRTKSRGNSYSRGVI